ncbi:hypothetical protein L210DRAFT_3645291 [Boletus edulis BED1]|uniref:Uncharacterized protein n=1 Tax=Boletus edulis BED1 TaxID=1328754 RepID=A0AAD4GEZ0_BOLED|nr:hypothetical protein L210DRAFT_3645291 [Boletus edulis BED1]
MTREVDPFVAAKLFNDPRDAGFRSIYSRECREGVDALTDGIQFRADRKKFSFASIFGLTDGNKTWSMSSSTNEGGQGWGHRELSSETPPDANAASSLVTSALVARTVKLNMKGVVIEQDDERVTVILACIDDDDWSLLGAYWRSEKRGKKETTEPW